MVERVRMTSLGKEKSWRTHGWFIKHRLPRISTDNSTKYKALLFMIWVSRFLTPTHSTQPQPTSAGKLG
jgi:hypothetical protein